MRPSDSALVTFPVYVTTPSDFDIGVMVSDYDIEVNQGDVNMNVTRWANSFGIILVLNLGVRG
jgi:hypothetical protein